MAQAVNSKARSKKNLRAKATAKTPETVTTGFLEGVTQEEQDADARLWTEKFNATTPEQLARLEKFLEGDPAEESVPLDFTGR
jgi:hypothetical protein